MMNIFKPEYLFRPKQIPLRLSRQWCKLSSPLQSIELPWKLPLQVNVQETVGRAIWYLGVYDLVVSECLWRLTEAEDIAVDAGANIGYMSSIMAYRTGPRGQVFSFEPHPVIAQTLSQNVAQWTKKDVAQCMVCEQALSNEEGQALLTVPEGFEKNQGVAFLSNGSSTSGLSIAVEKTTIASDFEGQDIGILKVDVEGHELALFQGAQGHLREKRIRDIVFEDHRPYPTEPMQYLESFGYTLFRLKRSFSGPVLSDATQDHEFPKWEPPNILATCNPERAIKIMKDRGWRVLQ